MMADASEADALTNDKEDCEKIDPDKSRFPYCIVWTPIPGLSWLLPFIGHMGICTSSGVIRDFAGPYCVSEDDMAFGRPTKYWRLDVSKVCGGSPEVWDAAVRDASQQYGHKMQARQVRKGGGSRLPLEPLKPARFTFTPLWAASASTAPCESSGSFAVCLEAVGCSKMKPSVFFSPTFPVIVFYLVACN
ncbi:uncharacterized protein [Paramormyrops kingsleyae]|uniref:uncharacterized protein isoform X1 n=1 Tax=Paramormyrops kingsleyae TaxID=1676925 RepID=UPI000CD62B96|nr:transmembrane protein 222-like isoform X1 [Paramormyrops kingsleyae]